MVRSQEPLPDFSQPPVVEVALSVQFQRLPGLGTAQVGLLWGEYRDRFPKTEDYPPLGTAFERFGVPPRNVDEIPWEIRTGPPTPRCWFLSEDGSELIQVQQDRFVFNWRKPDIGGDYPHYGNVRARFQEEINLIQSGPVWTRLGQVGEVIAVVNPEPRNTWLPECEEARLITRYIMRDPKGRPIGRLHIELESAVQESDGSPLFALKLTARGEPTGAGLDGVMSFFDLGREWIVRGFAAITTPVMHTVWGRRDVP